MKVSVIIPNYNHGRFLRQRLDSVLNQSWNDFEVIILDDCSTDNSREIIESYRSSPAVSYIRYNEKNSGSPFLQWKKGMNLAEGELIWIAESDDYCEPTLLEKLVKPFMDDEHCTLSFCASDKVDGSCKSKGLHENLVSMPELHLDGTRFNHKYMQRNRVVNASSAVFKKSAGITLNNGYDTLCGFGDYMFWIGIASMGNVNYTSEILNHFRFHETNKTASMSITSKGVYETMTINRFLKNMGIINGREFFTRNLSSAYRLKFIYGEEHPFNTPLFKAALFLKRIYRRLFNLFFHHSI